ncbi:MAG: hypothetical protein EAZ30_16460 [Betaproteobacteria bacterium]|nr:MAG: hypothetical protein EAZ30_16460 [Betaproteobacteria bacterium]
MNLTRYWVCAAGFCALLATTYFFSQHSQASGNAYSALSPLPSQTVIASDPQSHFCFNAELDAVSCEYEAMLGATGNASDIHHVVLVP